MLSEPQSKLSRKGESRTNERKVNEESKQRERWTANTIILFKQIHWKKWKNCIFCSANFVGREIAFSVLFWTVEAEFQRFWNRKRRRSSWRLTKEVIFFLFLLLPEMQLIKNSLHFDFDQKQTSTDSPRKHNNLKGLAKSLNRLVCIFLLLLFLSLSWFRFFVISLPFQTLWDLVQNAWVLGCLLLFLWQFSIDSTK